MFKDFMNFFDGWVNVAKSRANMLSNERLRLAAKRGDICRECPELVEEDRHIFNKYPYRCNICGCVFPAIVLSKNKKCPLGRW